MVKELILRKIIDYLKLVKWEFRRAGKITMLKCVYCKTNPTSANLIPNTPTVHCFFCNKNYNLIDIVKQLEPDKKDASEEDVLQYLKEKLKIDVTTEKEVKDVDKLLSFYEKLGFDLTPVVHNEKSAEVETAWQKNSHKNKNEWKHWLASGLNIGCFDEKTEILTDQGWKYFKNLDETEKVATLNWKTKNISYQPPLAYIQYPYYGKVYKIKSNTIDMCITPNHNVYYRQHSAKKVELKRIDMIKLNRFEIPITGKWQGGNSTYFRFPQDNWGKGINCKHKDKLDMKLFLEFLGWFISEGHLVKSDYKIIITQISNIYKKQIRELLEKLPYKFTKTKNAFMICNKQLYYYLKNSCYFINSNSKIRRKSVYCCYNKCVPNFVKALNSKLIQIILTSLVKGDGYKSKRTERYYTTSVKLSNDIQELYFKTGYASILNSRKPRTHVYNGKIIKGKVNALEIIKHIKKFRTVDRNKNIKLIDFKGIVYCVEVPNGIIYVRRNGHQYWSGNCKTGKLSNLTILDIDALDKKEKIELRSKEINDARRKELMKKRKENLDKVYNVLKPIIGDTLTQATLGGNHLFYQFEKDLPKTFIKIEGVSVDVENEGGQVVIAPSKVGGDYREFINDLTPIKMPDELKKLLMSKVTVPRKTDSERIRENIATGDFKIKPEDFKLINDNLNGCCNSSFVSLGGILRQGLNARQTEFVLETFNQHLLESPMDIKAIRGMCRELDNYIVFDQQELAHEIIEYLKDVKTSTKSDLELAISGNWTKGETKKRLNKTLQYLIKEDKIIQRGKKIEIVEEMDWNDGILDVGIPVDFKVPYFHNYVYFNRGDIIILGSQNKYGKTHLAMNMIKRLVDQGIKPYYIYSESGGRFAKIALHLGLKDRDFYRVHCSDPDRVKLKDHSVTIYDWVRPNKQEGWARTDLLFGGLTEKTEKAQGFLICFVQLRDTDRFFAPDQIGQHPALLIRYLYENPKDGTYTYFNADDTRESKIRVKRFKIPSIYDWDTKLVKLVEELSEEEKAKVMKALEKNGKK